MWRNLGRLFSPRILPLHLVGAAATAIAIWLGLWQLDVWQAHRAQEAQDLTDLSPVALAEVIGPDTPFPSSAVGRPVTVDGTWLPDSTFYVSGRESGGADGVWAVTPVAVCVVDAACSDASALLVVRGWTPDATSAPDAPEGRVALTGWLQPPEGSGVADQDPTDDVVPEVRIADAVQRVDQDLYGAFLVADTSRPGAALDGLDPVAPESRPTSDGGAGLRNFLYGLQWFLFAAFALFIWWRWVRDELDRSRRAEEAASATDDGARTVPDADDAEVASGP